MKTVNLISGRVGHMFTHEGVEYLAVKFEDAAKFGMPVGFEILKDFGGGDYVFWKYIGGTDVDKAVSLFKLGKY